METSSRQRRSMTQAIEAMPRQAMAPFAADASPEAGLGSGSRRRFLLGAGAGGALLSLAGVAGPASWLPIADADTTASDDTDGSDSGTSPSSPAAATTTTTAPPASGDNGFLVFACSLELAVHGAYQQLAAKVTDAAKKSTVTMFARHHLDHADAFRAAAATAKVLNPSPPKLVANTGLAADLGLKVAAAGDDDAVLRLAFDLENQLVSTYAFGLTQLEEAPAYSLVATVLPIDSEHAAALGATLGLGAAELFPAAFERAEVGDGNDPKVGFDPQAFPPSVSAAQAPSDSESSE